mmetsp:Transcript_14421/g.42967  ORF Transcript_14421/g.42967 Transcript_14421/m.42967 type:complete len:135 (+) Transcript_14421:294-698(+)
MYDLQITRARDCKLILAQMLAVGLIQKRRAAEIALELTEDSYEKAREEMASVVGNQRRYQRLDAAGCERSRLIHRLRRRLCYFQQSSGSAAQAQHVRDEIRSLVKHHAELSAQASVSLLRSDIRAMLRQGARAW